MNNTPANSTLTLRPVGQDNWRAVARLTVGEDQRAFVAEPAYYLAMCAYGGLWQPLAIEVGGQTVGMLLWAVDPEDQSCWLGGFLVDQGQQRRGYGRQAIRAAIAQLAAEHGHRNFALSYSPDNGVAKALYQSLGFAETGEEVDDEVVARLTLATPDG